MKNRLPRVDAFEGTISLVDGGTCDLIVMVKALY